MTGNRGGIPGHSEHNVSKDPGWVGEPEEVKHVKGKNILNRPQPWALPEWNPRLSSQRRRGKLGGPCAQGSEGRGRDVGGSRAATSSRPRPSDQPPPSRWRASGAGLRDTPRSPPAPTPPLPAYVFGSSWSLWSQERKHPGLPQSPLVAGKARRPTAPRSPW